MDRKIHRNFEMNGQSFGIAVAQHGHGAPTEKTEGLIGVRYRDDDTGNLYVCTDETIGAFKWEREADNESTHEEILKATSELAPAYKKTVQGEVITVSDVSPAEHDVGCKVERLQLLPQNYSTQTINGVTFTVNSDKSISTSGTATDVTYFVLQLTNDLPPDFFKKPMFLSGCPAPVGKEYALRLWGMQGVSGIDSLNDYGKGVSIPAEIIPAVDAPEAEFDILVRAGTNMNGKTFKPMLNHGESAIPYTPYIPDLSKVMVSQTGKNILDIDKFFNFGALAQYVQISGSHVECTALNDARYASPMILLPTARRIYLSGNIKNGTSVNVKLVLYNGTSAISTLSEGVSKITGVADRIKLDYKSAGSCSFDNLMITFADDQTYEKDDFNYFAPSSDGTILGINSIAPNMTILTDTPGAVITATYNLDTVDKHRFPATFKGDSELAPAYKKFATGEAIMVNDVSPAEHSVKCKIENKNLAYEIKPGYIYSGKFSKHGAYRTAMAHVKSGKVTLSTDSELIYVRYGLNGINHEIHNPVIDHYELDLPEDGLLYFVVSTDFDESPFTVEPKIQIEQGDTRTPYTPYISDLSTVKLSRYGQNIIDKSKWAIFDAYYGQHIEQLLPKKENYILKIKKKNSDPIASGYYLGFVWRIKGTNPFSDWLIKNGAMLKNQECMSVVSSETNFGAAVCCYPSDKLNYTFENFEIYLVDKRYGTEYLVLPDGSITDMTSVSPTMTLFADTPGVILEAEYNADTIEKVNTPIAANSFAPAIPVTMTGPAVATDMVSPVEHDVACKVESKNEIFGEIASAGTVIQCGFILKLKAGVQYTASINIPALAFYVEIPLPGGGAKIIFYDDAVDGKRNSFTFTADKDYEKARVKGYAYSSDTPKTIQFEKGSVATPYTPYLPDLSAVTVRQYGGNLWAKGSKVNIIGNGQGQYPISFTLPYKINSANIAYELNTKDVVYTGSAYVVAMSVTRESGAVAYYGIVNPGDPNGKKSISIPFNDSPIEKISWASGAAFESGEVSIENISMTLINTDEYELYKEPITFTPSPEGVVTGMKSIAPNMTILTDTPGTIITASYGADTKLYIDKKFAELQAAVLKSTKESTQTKYSTTSDTDVPGFTEKNTSDLVEP